MYRVSENDRTGYSLRPVARVRWQMTDSQESDRKGRGSIELCNSFRCPVWRAMARNARSECMMALALLSSHCAIGSDDEEKTFSITSEPPGAHVVLNGRDRGITPLGMKVGH